MNDEKTSNPFENARTALTWLMFLCRSLAVTLEVFVHRRFGSRYFGAQAGVGALLILLFPMLMPEHDPRFLWGYLLTYIAALTAARIGIWWRCRKAPDTEHSYYNGRPGLLRRFPKLSESTCKQTIEPILLAILGCMWMLINVPLGLYWVVAAIAMALCAQTHEAMMQKRVTDMQDAMIEQGHLARRMRNVSCKVSNN